MMPSPGIEPAGGIPPIMVAVVEVPVLSGIRPTRPEGGSLAVASEGRAAHLCRGASTRTRDIVKRLRAFVLQAIGPFST